MTTSSCSTPSVPTFTHRDCSAPTPSPGTWSPSSAGATVTTSHPRNAVTKVELSKKPRYLVTSKKSVRWRMFRITRIRTIYDPTASNHDIIIHSIYYSPESSLCMLGSVVHGGDSGLLCYANAQNSIVNSIVKCSAIDWVCSEGYI